ncbi:MAG: class I SAM-dependent methyltransferase [Calditrichaeota bacterium]|nr:class I SAM-dependent methyltransferase [Calditrichota bacterium]
MAKKIDFSLNPELDQPLRSYFNGLAADWEKMQLIDDSKLFSLLCRLPFSGAKRILDVGCGTGALFPHLLRLADLDAQIIALDFAESMALEAANHTNHQIEILCGDILRLPVQKNSVDIIIAFQVFPHLKNKNLALRQCWQALRQGGELAIIHLQGSRQLNAFHAGLNGVVADHNLPSAEKMKEMFEQQNFDVNWWVDEPEEYFVSGKKKTI